MKLILILFMIVWVVGQQSSQPPATQSTPPTPGSKQNPAQPSSAKAPVKRVHLKLDGFELSKNPITTSGTQIGGASRGAGSEVTTYAPQIGTAYTTTPSFAWSGETNSKTFVFHVYNEDGDSLYETKITGNSLRYPSTAPALEPGRAYSWMVQPEIGSMAGGGATVQFIILSRPERDALASALAAAGSDSFNSALERAKIFTEKRLWYDAIAAYSELIEQHPRMADLYEQRGEIYDQIPATQKLAEEDFRKADELQGNK
jgi:hypothetical protein